LKSLSDRYKEEHEKAVIGPGEWQFLPEYQVPEAFWFSHMNAASKAKHVKEVFNCPVVQLTVASSPHSAGHSSTKVLEVDIKDCGIRSLSMSLLKDMWGKAERLVSLDGGILKVPWSTDANSRLVMSSSSEHPHIVKTNPRCKKQYICDEKCLMFKGCSICSHTIAVNINGHLSDFLEYYKQKKCGPNLSYKNYNFDC
jgi:hypothetical protein